MIWAQLLAYVTGTVDQELLLRNEYLATENRILKAQIKGSAVTHTRRKSHLGRDRPKSSYDGNGFLDDVELVNKALKRDANPRHIGTDLRPRLRNLF